ncbi:thioesterase II family protein [Streptomyces sp. TRM70350]|uniref:thioesterase II family protein n=1 Tax=Streptomyces sp. TRM70350 TaxID=2856165 RepID=UPI001C46D8F5|nr:alpha/beta fold hydrolase [Streptomyces sp. TRM70350]MBV7699711.1 alpha/beta fold hydrolase [Streptomyces sp. TRM70350]
MGSEWLRRFAPPTAGRNPAADAPRLFCFPHAGGAASAFLPLARVLAPTLDVLAAQYPGRQDRWRERPVEDLARLADALTEQVRQEATGTYALFGHSMGAVLAYEVARRLADRHSIRPAALILSGRGAPGGAPNPHDRLTTDEEILRAVRRLGGTTSRVLDDPELRDLAMPALRADYAALGSYAWTPGPPLTVPVTVLIGDSDPVVAVAHAEAWRHLTTAPTRTHVFTGGHFFLDEHLPEVAGAVVAALSSRTARKAALGRDSGR